LGGIFEEIVAALEALVKLGNPPRGDNLDIGLQGIVAQFEADLVVALAGAAVRDGKAALLFGDSNLAAGDDGAGERGAEEVDVFVNGIALDGGEAELLDKLLTEIDNVYGACTNLEGLLFGSLEVLLLADVGHEANDIVALLEEPGKDGTGVQSSGVSKADLLLDHFDYRLQLNNRIRIQSRRGASMCG